MTEQKINKENIENNLVFCIEPRKAFAIKSMPRSAFRNPSHMNKTRIFSISVKVLIWFLYKTMTKQTVYLNNFVRKSGFILQFLRQSAFYTRHRCRGLMTSPITALHGYSNWRDVFVKTLLYMYFQVWKRSGAWFFKGLPKYVIPEKKNEGSKHGGGPGKGKGDYRESPKGRTGSLRHYNNWSRGRGKKLRIYLKGFSPKDAKLHF